ncbi:MAG: TIGR03557 family F420-dependent LLM class oxidoreductase [Dehalococcoidia bacterium]
MVSIGYALSSEEHPARDLVAHATQAEAAGFSFALISDHFHPWVERQGHSPFVWSVLGAIAMATDRLQVGTGVTCPTVRIHPAIVAQAAATVSTMMPGRFFLGVGTGENLNEHVLGDHWPTTEIRQEMLREAVDVMRELWQGSLTSRYGEYYVVEQAKLYTVPDVPPPIYVAASGMGSAALAGDIGDGLCSTAPSAEVVEAFERAGGEGKPRIAMAHVSWAESEEAGLRTAHEWWPNSALGGALGQELRSPFDFEAATALVRPDDLAGSLPCGPEPAPILDEIRKFVEAGYDYVYLHQVGPEQERFIDFCAREVLPRLHLEPARLCGRGD